MRSATASPVHNSYRETTASHVTTASPLHNNNYSYHRCSNIEHDGRIVSTSGDPPGQRSIYILPGDPEEERYRMTTFTKYPISSGVDSRALARNGFLYTGYKDRVKCFSCGVQVENWLAEDDPSSRTWHFLNCEFYTGIPARNKPLGNNLRTLVHQTSSLPHSSNTSSPVRNVSRTASAGPVPNPATYQSRSQDRRPNHSSPVHHLPNTISMSFNMTMTNHQPASPQHSSLSPEQLQQRYPCRHPINPHMRYLAGRLATYEVGWQASRVRASPRELATAGLYFLGQRDKTKCWYCNGGLQNWEYDDDPWFEHAKWFPQCEYLLQNKGPDYVDNIVRQFPNLRRPVIRHPTRRQVVSGLDRHQLPGRRLARSPRQNLAPEGPIQIIDPREEMKKLRRRVKEEIRKSSGIVSGAEEMGFDRKQIRAAFKRKLQASNKSFAGLGDLVDSIVSHQGPVESESDSDAEEPGSTSHGNSSQPLSAREEVRRLEEERICKICKEGDVEVVFLPCGHLVSCMRCSSNVTHCPLCKTEITQKVRTYAS